MVAQRVALAVEDAEGELVPDVRVVRVADRQHDLRALRRQPGVLSLEALAVRGVGLHHAGEFREFGDVVRGVALTVGGVLGVALHFDAQEGALQRVHAEIAADVVMVVFRLAAVHTQHACVFSQVVVIRHQHAAVSEAAEVLAREEAVGAEVAHRAAVTAFIPRADRLRCVLDHLEALLLRQREDGVHVRALAEQMHRHDDLRFGSDLFPCVVDVHVEADRADIGEDRHGAETRNRARRGEKGERRAQHLVTRLDVQRHERQQQRIRAGGNRQCMLHTDHFGDFLFKRLHLRPHDEPPMFQHLCEGGLEFGFERVVLGVDVEERDHGRWVRMMNDE